MAKNDSKRPEHTRGGTTTRDDRTDLGVPMLAGDPSEPAGPEDAFGPGPKRGDYSGRTGNTRSHQTVPIPDAKPGEPNVRVVSQTGRANDQGEVAKVKGGVDTSE